LNPTMHGPCVPYLLILIVGSSLFPRSQCLFPEFLIYFLPACHLSWRGRTNPQSPAHFPALCYFSLGRSEQQFSLSASAIRYSSEDHVKQRTPTSASPSCSLFLSYSMRWPDSCFFFFFRLVDLPLTAPGQKPLR